MVGNLDISYVLLEMFTTIIGSTYEGLNMFITDDEVFGTN